MGLRLFFLLNFPGAMFIQGATFIPDSRVLTFFKKGDIIQGETLFKGGHYLRKYGI